MALFIQDVRHFLRALRRTPGFALIAVLTLGLGIGVTTTVVGVVDHVLFHSLPFRDDHRLMMVLERGEKGGFRGPSAPTANDWAADPASKQAFDGLTFVRGDGAALVVGDHTEHIGVAYVAPDFNGIMQVQPALGRLLVADDHTPSASPVAVISYALWQRAFGGGRDVLGKVVGIDGVPTTVVGVMPLGGAYPGFADAWQPISHYAHQDALAKRGLHVDSRVIARLKPGVDSARAVALLENADARLAAAYPVEQAHWSIAFYPIRNEILGGIGTTLYTLGGAALAILLLACANVANLLLARVASRGRELAVRSALGASRARIAGQLLAESLTLSFVGGVLGILIAVGGVRLARTIPATRLPRVDELALDGRVLLVALGASVMTTLICGLWPAWRASRGSSLEVLRASASGSVGMRSDARLRRALVSVQFALALVLLVSAGLLIQSFRRATSVDVGFDPHRLISVRLNPSVKTYGSPEALGALWARLIDQMKATPGVTDAAFIQHFPFGNASIRTAVEIDGQPASDSASHEVFYRSVSDGYLKTMRMSVKRGRWFDVSDMRSPGAGFVINQTMARSYFGTDDAVGRRLTIRRSAQGRANFGEPLPGVVIGVVADVHQASQDVAPWPEVYVPYTLEPWSWGSIVVRSRDAAHAIPTLRAAISGVDPTLIENSADGNSRLSIVENSIQAALEPRKLSMSLLGGFAACAALLAAIGMYGVIAYGVTQRTREIGVRKALGASDRAIGGLVMRESMMLAGIGIAVGCAGAWGCARLIREQLFDTGVVDPVSYAATIAGLTAVAVIATYVPMRRASRLDPTLAMRAD